MSPLALELIEKEKEEKTGYLDLGRCGLKEMPDLSGLTWLETLILVDRWWDRKTRAWTYSKNKGKPNKIAIASKDFFPKKLKEIWFGGTDWNKKWDIEEVSFLASLTSLESLSLCFTQVKQVSFLENLVHLKALDLSFNSITDVNFIQKLPNLSTLDLADNQIKDIQFLKGRKGLVGLDLSSNKISDWSFLETLTNLQSLGLNECQVTDFSFLKQMKQVKALHLEANSLDNLDFLEETLDLRVLILGQNRITSGNLLKNFQNLEILDLSSNKITDWDFLKTLAKLKKLDLHANSISDLPQVSELNNLEILYLSDNHLKRIDFLKGLSKLRVLSLDSNQITDIESLINLTTIDTLNLSSNRILNFEPLRKLVNLSTLELRDSQLSELGFIEHIPKLEILLISNNHITKWPFTQKLSNLCRIDLTQNLLRDIKPLLVYTPDMDIIWQEWYDTDFWQINIKDNPVINPPTEIIKLGNEAIIEFFHQIDQDWIRLLEAKLILLGDGRAGKTSLANRLLGKELPAESDRTQGVNVIIGEHQFQSEEGDPFTIHIWDFAGQDKYRPLHQFFYTEDAVYVLVTDSADAKIDYDDWFQTAQVFGAGSPLIIALNEFREGMGSMFDAEYWKKRFPNLIRGEFLVNLKSKTNFEALKRAIQYQAQTLPHTQDKYPQLWLKIRKALEQRREDNFISFQEYLKICRDNGMSEKDNARVLIDILHKIGVCFYYKQNEWLSQQVILKNEWATDAVYKIIEDRIVAENKKGIFDREDLKRVWTHESYSTMRPQLLELMREFKMAYPLPNGQEFVLPYFLPSVKPADWEFPQEDNISLYIVYEFLPKALFTQFVVSRYLDIDRDRTLLWRNGVVLRWPDALAEVVKTKSKGLDAFIIRAQGSNRKGLLTSILKTFRDLQSEYKGIKVNELVPCICSKCENDNSEEPYFFKFDSLQKRLEKDIITVTCDLSFLEVPILKLFGDMFYFDHMKRGQPVKLGNPSRPTALLAFISYADEDFNYFQKFQKQLYPFKQNGKIRTWSKLDIKAGEEVPLEIQKNLVSAQIIFLLLSPDYLVNDSIHENEFLKTFELYNQGSTKVVPIIIRPCLWKETVFKDLQSLPRGDKFISEGNEDNEDATWYEIMNEISKMLEV